MAYLAPPWFTRKVFNPIAMRLGLAGTTPLTVPGRRSGRPMSVPVIPVELDGARYVVSTRGEADWVRNVRASGRGELGSETFRATELPLDQRPPVIAAYRAKAGRSVAGYWGKLPDPADHPVFRLDAGA